MASKLRSYDPKYDWVKVRSNRKHNLGKREWNNQTNVPIKEGEELILPRGSSDPDEELSGMKFYFKNSFYEVVDADPDLPDTESAPEDNDDNTFNCPECDRSFDTEQGMKTHKRQKHEDNKKEEKED